MRRHSNHSKRNSYLIGIFIIVIMIGSTAGYYFGEGDGNVIRYNGFRLTQNNNGIWETKIDGRAVKFYYRPELIEGFSSNIKKEPLQSLKSSKMFYITFDSSAPKENLQYTELIILELSNTLSNYNIQVTSARADSLEPSDYRNLPTIKCSEATQFVPVVYLKTAESAETTSFEDSFENNCWTITVSTPEDLLKLRDSILYYFLGIIR